MPVTIVNSFVVAPQHFREVDCHQHQSASRTAEARLGLVFLEKLRLQLHRQVADFPLGKQGFLNSSLVAEAGVGERPSARSNGRA